MQKLREPQRARDAETHDERVQALAPIELKILRGVDQIESRDPSDHARSEEQGSQRQPAGRRDPGAGRRDGEREAKKKMARRGESLGQRIEENDRRARAARAAKSCG